MGAEKIYDKMPETLDFMQVLSIFIHSSFTDSGFGNPSDPTTYSYNGAAGTSFTSNNQILLKDDDVATYTRVLSQNGYLEIQELGSNTLQYDNGTTNVSIPGNPTISSLFSTSWQYYADSTGGSPTLTNSGNNSTGPAQDTTNTGYFQWVGTTTKPSKVKFTNTLKTQNITITKNCTGLPDEVSSQNFDFTITLDNVGGIGLEESDFDGTSDGSDDTNATIKITKRLTFTSSNYSTNQIITISNVPVGTSYTIAETVPIDGYKAPTFVGSLSANGDTGTITDSDVSVTITNTPEDTIVQPAEPVEISLQVQKIWAANTDIPEDGVYFKVEQSTNSGVDWSKVRDGNTLINNDGILHITASSPTVVTNEGDRVIWTVTLTGTNIKNLTAAGGTYIQYRILEYSAAAHTSSDNTLAAEADFNDDWTVWYSFSTGGEAAPQNIKTATSSDTLTLAIMNNKQQSAIDTPETGGRGGYVPVAGGFIAILLAGAGYFIYKKRIFA